MFTGLVETTGEVRAVAPDSAGARLEVASPLAQELRAGDSIAVGGVCLTAAHAANGAFTAHVMAETLRRSTLGALEAGDRVNLELPLRAGDRLGGHLVQGHVDGLGTVEALVDEGLARLVTIACSPRLLRYVVEKGSIAVDGVSLTVASADGDRFAVSLTPETLERTTLGEVREGDGLNVEADVVAKYVRRSVSPWRK